MGFLDFLFPKYCINCKKMGSYLCPNCFSLISFSENETCLSCGKNSIDGLTHPVCRRKLMIDGSFTSILYKGVVKKLVYKFKYKPFITDLKEIIGDFFYEGLVEKENFILNLKKETVLVPIPLFSKKLKKRGYNQAEILAFELSKRFGNKVILALERIKDTKTQVGFTREQRRENIKGAFKILNNYQSQISNKTIFLIDDVLTTGSTFVEAAKVLKQKGAKCVFGLALSKD